MQFKRLLEAAAAACLGALVATSAIAQDYPNRPVKIVAPYAPGGQADVIARIVCQLASPILGQQCVVENRPGAGGIPGSDFVAKATPDGYTLLICDSGQWAIAPAMQAKMPFDPIKDLTPVALVTTSSIFMAVHPGMPAATLQEFVPAVRAKPGGYHYGSSGNATVHHLTMEAFKAALGLDITHVPFKGAGQSVPAVVSGQVPIVIAGFTNLASYAKAGQVRLLAVTTKKRTPLAPDVPAMAEAGAPDVDFPGELAIFGPTGLPRTVVEKMSAVLKSVTQMPDYEKRTNAVGIEPAFSTPEGLLEIVRVDQTKYARAVKVSGAKVE